MNKMKFLCEDFAQVGQLVEALQNNGFHLKWWDIPTNCYAVYARDGLVMLGFAHNFTHDSPDVWGYEIRDAATYIRDGIGIVESEKFLEDAYTENCSLYTDVEYDTDIPPPQGRVIDITEAIQIAKGAGWTSVGSAPEGWTEQPKGECIMTINRDLTATFPEPKRNKYMREIKPGVWVDVYSVINAFKVTDPCLQHLLKKALAVGQRGHKDEKEDYLDILASAKRAVELYEEWHDNA